MKNKLVVLHCVDCNKEEIEELAKTLHDLDLPYQFLVTNKEFKPIDRDKLIEIIKGLP